MAHNLIIYTYWLIIGIFYIAKTRAKNKKGAKSVPNSMIKYLPSLIIADLKEDYTTANH